MNRKQLLVFSDAIISDNDKDRLGHDIRIATMDHVTVHDNGCAWCSVVRNFNQ